MKKFRKIPLSFRFLLLLLFLCVIGLFFVFEASVVESFLNFGHQYFYFYRQASWFLVGVMAFCFGWIIPTNIWKKFAPLLFILGLMMLSLVFIPSLGIEINGAKRWFIIAGVSVQPVEFFKLFLILYFSSWLCTHQRLLPFIITLFPVVLILLFQPDFGSLLVTLFISSILFFTAGGSIKKIFPVAIGAVLFLSLAVFVSPYRIKRVQTFFNPEKDPLGASFQIRQITLALGSGGLFGQGLGNSQQKYAFIPEASSDSIFAIIAEEIGFVGSIFLLSIIILYIFSLYQISTRQPTGSFEQLLATGLWAWISGQTLLNLGAVVALVPLTGLPLPFFSYGGSSLVSLLFMNGIIYKLIKKQ